MLGGVLPVVEVVVEGGADSAMIVSLCFHIFLFYFVHTTDNSSLRRDDGGTNSKSKSFWFWL